MKIIVDTREKKEIVIDYCKSKGIPWERQKLDYGDYAIVDDSGVQHPFTVERKNSLKELAGNLTVKNLARFEHEFQRSNGNMAVVCCGNFEDIAEHGYMHSLPPRYFLARIKRLTKEYGIPFYFGVVGHVERIVNLLIEKASGKVNPSESFVI